jgi:hypothetical protein
MKKVIFVRYTKDGTNYTHTIPRDIPDNGVRDWCVMNLHINRSSVTSWERRTVRAH